MNRNFPENTNVQKAHEKDFPLLIMRDIQMKARRCHFTKQIGIRQKERKQPVLVQMQGERGSHLLLVEIPAGPDILENGMGDPQKPRN